MLHLGNNIDRIQQLLISMLQRRDQWLKHLAQPGDGAKRRSQLEQALQNYVREHLQTLKSGLPAGLLESLCELADFARNNLETDKPSIILNWQDNNTLSTNPESLDQWQILAELLLTGKMNHARQSPRPQAFQRQVRKKKMPNVKRCYNFIKTACLT